MTSNVVWKTFDDLRAYVYGSAHASLKRSRLVEKFDGMMLALCGSRPVNPR